MPPTPPKPKTPPPPPTASAPKPKQQAAPMSVVSGRSVAAHRTVIYGPGGAGKSELAANIQQVGVKPLFFDLDSETQFLDVARVRPTDFDQLLGGLADDTLLAPYSAVVIESFTKAEEMAAKWVLANIKSESGNVVTSLEGYGWGKGYVHVYDAFLRLLEALDAVVAKGKHVICTAHDCSREVPNAMGEDYLQFQPRLQSPREKGKIRERVKEWCDHLLYIDIEACVSEGKAYGDGRRVIRTCQMPTHWAKSRCTAEPVVYQRGSGDIWEVLLGGK